MRLAIIGTHLFYGPNRLPFSLFWLVVVQFLPDNEPENLWSRAHILALKHFRKCAMIPGKLACDPCQSVFSFLPWRALVKTMGLEAIRILSYFRLDTLILRTTRSKKDGYWNGNDKFYCCRGGAT